MPHHAEGACTILGLDPGTNTFGLGWLNCDIASLQILNTQSMLLVADKMNPSPWYAEVNCDRHARLQVLSQSLFQVLCYLRPVCVVTESPFFNSSRPNAYQALVETIEMIRHTVYAYDRCMSVNYIDPPSVKRAVGAAGNAKKEEVQSRVVALSELNYFGSCPLPQLDEHSVDAIAVAYSKLIEFRRNRT